MTASPSPHALAAAKLKPGDTVRLLRRVESARDGWCNSWTVCMSKDLINKVKLTVIDIDEQRGVRVKDRFDRYPAHALGIISRVPPATDVIASTLNKPAEEAAFVLTHTPIHPALPKENTMSNIPKIENVILLDGSRVENFTDDGLIEMIRQLEKDKKSLEELETTNKMIKSKIDSIEAAIARINELLDERFEKNNPKKKKE